MNILLRLFDLVYIYEQGGIDTVVYAIMAIGGTLLFVLRLAMMLLLGMDSDVDFDSDALEHGGGDFSVFSVISVVAFFMGAGWAGLAARLEWGLSTAPAAVIAGGFGTAMMLFAAALMMGAIKLKHEVHYELKDAVGRVGTVYMSIPPKGQGSGKIRIGVSGRSMIVDAVQNGEEKLESFADIKVIEMRDEKTFIVEPA